MKKTALVTGISGQDGAYLSQILLGEGYSVTGVSRDPSPRTNWRLVELGLFDHPELNVVECDLSDPAQTSNLLSQLKPDEVYNLASHSFVSDSQDLAYKTAIVSGISVLNLLEAIKQKSPKSRFVQAGSSELFGNANESPQNELSRFLPRNLYATSKLLAHHAVLNYRDNSSIFAANAILYNHESPLRDAQFVTRKVSRAVAEISSNRRQSMEIGNLSATRDWGYAPEYAIAMHRVVKHSEPETFVIASGRATTVREFVRLAFEVVGLQVVFTGNGTEEKGFDAKTGRELVSTNPQFFREAERIPLLGDPSKASQALGWKADTQVGEIVRQMVESDVALLDKKKN